MQLILETLFVMVGAGAAALGRRLRIIYCTLFLLLSPATVDNKCGYSTRPRVTVESTPRRLQKVQPS